MLHILLEESREPVEPNAATAGKSLHIKMGESTPRGASNISVERLVQPNIHCAHAHGVGAAQEGSDGQIRRNDGLRPAPTHSDSTQSELGGSTYGDVRLSDDALIGRLAQPNLLCAHTPSFRRRRRNISQLEKSLADHPG